MFSNIFVFTIAEVWSQGLRDSFCFDWRMFCIRTKTKLRFLQKLLSFIYLFVFSLNKDIFFRSRFELSENVLNTNFNVRSREIHGNFA